MNFLTFSVATTTIFPIANSKAGGQLTTEWNLKSRETVGTFSDIKYEVGPSYTHSAEDFTVDVQKNELGDIISNSTLTISEGRAVINGHYVKTLAPMVIDLLKANEELQKNGKDKLEGKLGIGIRSYYSTESTMMGALAAEDDNDVYRGIQLVIVPEKQLKTPRDCPNNRNKVTCDLKLGVFEFYNGTVVNATVDNKFNEEKLQYIDANRIANIDSRLEGSYVSRAGLNPKHLYTMAGKGDANGDYWCSSEDALVIWDSEVERTTYEPAEKEAQFGYHDNNLALALPHKQIPDMSIVDVEGNEIPEYFATKYLDVPAADYESGLPGVVDKTLINRIKELRSNVDGWTSQQLKGKQRLYIDLISDDGNKRYSKFYETNVLDEATDKLIPHWNVGDYVLVGRDYLVDPSVNEATMAPSTMYAVIPGEIKEVQFVESNTTGETPKSLKGIQVGGTKEVTEEPPVDDSVLELLGDDSKIVYKPLGSTNLPDNEQSIEKGSVVYTTDEGYVYDDKSYLTLSESKKEEVDKAGTYQLTYNAEESKKSDITAKPIDLGLAPLEYNDDVDKTILDIFNFEVETNSDNTFKVTTTKEVYKPGSEVNKDSEGKIYLKTDSPITDDKMGTKVVENPEGKEQGLYLDTETKYVNSSEYYIQTYEEVTSDVQLDSCIISTNVNGTTMYLARATDQKHINLLGSTGVYLSPTQGDNTNWYISGTYDLDDKGKITNIRNSVTLYQIDEVKKKVVLNVKESTIKEKKVTVKGSDLGNIYTLDKDGNKVDRTKEWESKDIVIRSEYIEYETKPKTVDVYNYEYYYLTAELIDSMYKIIAYPVSASPEDIENRNDLSEEAKSSNPSTNMDMQWNLLNLHGETPIMSAAYGKALFAQSLQIIQNTVYLIDYTTGMLTAQVPTSLSPNKTVQRETRKLGTIKLNYTKKTQSEEILKHYTDEVELCGEVDCDFLRLSYSYVDTETEKNITKYYYYKVSVEGQRTLTLDTPIIATRKIDFATEEQVGGFLNVPIEALDNGYVYRNADGYLQLLDYGLLRNNTLAYQFGNDLDLSNLSYDEIQVSLNDYVNDRVCFANEQKQNEVINNGGSLYDIKLTINLTDVEDTQQGVLNIYNIDSRFGSFVHLILTGSARSNVTINITNVEKIKIDWSSLDVDTTDMPVINLYNCGLYYDAGVMNFIAQSHKIGTSSFDGSTGFTELSLWYQKLEDSDPDLIVDGLTVSQINIPVISHEIDIWNQTSQNDNHYHVALQSVTYASDGTVSGFGLFVANDTTANIQEGHYITSGKFVLPQNYGLSYPEKLLTHEMKVSGTFESMYSVEAVDTWKLISTNFTAITQAYDVYGYTSTLQGSILFHINVNTVHANIPGDPMAWEPDTYHIFYGGCIA